MSVRIFLMCYFKMLQKRKSHMVLKDQCLLKLFVFEFLKNLLLNKFYS